MRTWCYVGVLVWLYTAAGAREPESFADAEDETSLESESADSESPQRLYLRWRVRGKQIDIDQLQFYQRLEWRPAEGREFFLLTERDPGERRWADFVAWYLRWERAPLQVVVGDLRPGFGAGLVFGRGSGRNSVQTARLRRDSERLGYRSSGENQSLRGAVLRYRMGRFTGVVLGGRARWDARMDGEGRVTSLPETGLHVSETEEAGRRLLSVWVGGGRLRCAAPRWSGGLSFQETRFDRRVDLRHPGKTPWAFRGREQRLWGMDVRAGLGKVEGAGEAARDGRGHWAGAGSVRVDLGGARLGGLVRHYDPGFHSFFGDAPRAAGMQNEQGYLLVLEGRGWRVFADQYRRPQPSYFNPLPAVAAVWGGSLGFRPDRGWRVQVLLQDEERTRWRGGTGSVERSRKGRLDLEFRQRRGARARVRLRLEGRHLRESVKGEEAGGLVSLLWQGRWNAGRFVLHLTRFLTASYHTRIYRDLLSSIAIHRQTLPISTSYIHSFLTLYERIVAR